MPAQPPPLREVTGLDGLRRPAARRFVDLTVTLAVLDFKVRYFGSALGYLWQLMRPLMLFGVLFVVFTEFVKFNEGVKFFPAVLLTAIMLFTFFSDATGAAVTAVLDRENLVRKIQFPRVVVPLAVGAHRDASTCSRTSWRWRCSCWPSACGRCGRGCWFPLLCWPCCARWPPALSMLLSALYVRFRDVEPIWEVILQVLFYGSPILYAIEIVPSDTARQADHVQPASPRSSSRSATG